MSEVRGRGREYQTATGQERPRGATPRPRSGGVAQRRYPASEARGGDERSYPTSEVRKGCGEEIPVVQGKEQWLRFAGAAVKRFPMLEVRETQVRW